jgi:hypothetical protein
MANTKITIEENSDDEKDVEEIQFDNPVNEALGGIGVVEIIDPDAPAEEYGMTVEDLDPTEELWPGGPTAGKIIEWKEQFGDVYVTSITMDQHIVWRTMNRFEYKNHVKNIEKLGQANQISQADISMLNEELIAEMCILFPKFDRSELNGELAGVPSIIAQEVMEASGFVALEVRQL